MSWWTSANVEPKRKSRFIVEIANGFFLPNVKTCSKPSANVDLKEFQLINHKFKYPGVVTWGDIKITMIDMRGAGEADRTLDTGLLLWRMLKHTGYNFPTEAVGPIAALGPNRQLSTTEKASSIANGFGAGLYGKADTSEAHVGNPTNNQAVKIYTLAPNGSTVEKWTLHNPQVKSVNWGDHTYDSDEFVEYSLDISYDWAVHETTNGDLSGPISIGEKYEHFYNAVKYKSKGGSLSDFRLSDLETDEERAEEARRENEQYARDNPVPSLAIQNIQDPGERFLAETGADREFVIIDGQPFYHNATKKFDLE